MSLVRATSRRGRALQAAARPAGIVFPTGPQTLAIVERAGLVIDDVRVRRVVTRLIAHRPS